MNLQQYPRLIADLEAQLLKFNQEVEIQLEILGFLKEDIEMAIAQNKDLKNEQQRKAYRIQQQQQPDYLDITRALKAAKEERDLCQIELNRVKNEFSVTKLETRLHIASLESVA